jgi:transposase InsO family protein
MKYAFIAAHATVYRVERMCRVLNVARSGYYAWHKRQPSQRARANTALLVHIRAIHEHSRCTYGSPRVHAALCQAGIACGRHRVARLMRQYELRACYKRRKRPKTTQPGPGPVAANILNREFEAQRPNEKWVTDITYIDTYEGWLYLATILDLFSRKVVGWSMADHLRTSLAEQALRMALNQRYADAPLLHHSDRGCQYTSDDYLGHLADAGITVSMSRTGNCYDNAVIESFFGTLKTECVTAPFATRQQARTTIFEYIEGWYNRQRLHSTLGYLSPVQFEPLYDL